MSTPVQIGRNFREWWFLALIFLAVVLVAAGTMLLAVRHPAAVFVLVAGGVACISVCCTALLIARSRFQVDTTPGGFLVRDRRGERTFDDDQVICASLSSRANYTNGMLQSTTRTFDVWVEGEAGAERVKMVSRLPVGTPDPLSFLIDRVQQHLYERAGAALEAGQAFDGEGWTLHATELVVNARRNVQQVRFEALAAADIFDNHLCIWKHGLDAPVLRIPMHSANTHVLLRLLRERITPRSEGAEPHSGDGLGRVLFERKPERGMTGLMYLSPFAALLVLAVAAVLDALQIVRDAWWVAAAVCTGIALIWVISLTHSIAFRVHEHGVLRKWLFGTQQLQYADVDAFTYSAVRQYVKGVYSGTNFTLTFASFADGKLKKLTYSRNLRNADAELDQLRDTISERIANRMAAQFALGRAVMWTDGLRFLPEGLEYRAAGFFGRKAPVLFPYSQIAGFDANQGTYWLWVHGRKKPVVKENMALPNFYPGFLFLPRLLAARAIEEAPNR
jgi:hypothetical protein